MAEPQPGGGFSYGGRISNLGKRFWSVVGIVVILVAVGLAGSSLTGYTIATTSIADLNASLAECRADLRNSVLNNENCRQETLDLRAASSNLQTTLNSYAANFSDTKKSLDSCTTDLGSTKADLETCQSNFSSKSADYSVLALNFANKHCCSINILTGSKYTHYKVSNNEIVCLAAPDPDAKEGGELSC